MNPECPYCGGESILVKGDSIYPNGSDLHDLSFSQCAPCEAYVGCHKGSDRPMGRLANSKLRSLKSEAHSHFDPIWKYGSMSRTRAYQWLAEKMGIEPRFCHIGMMSEDQCKQVIKICIARTKSQAGRKLSFSRRSMNQ